MNKKTFQIIMLIISVISLIYLILSYYGLIRYGENSLYHTEHYIKRYVQIPKKEGSKIAVYFSSSGENLKSFVNSILDQTIQVNDIGIVIPYKDIPNISNDVKPALSIYGYIRDYDDASDLISSVLRETEANTKIIIIEPNKIYGKDFIQTLVEESDKNPDKIIHINNINSKNMLIKPSFFNEKIAEYEKGKGCISWLNECQNVESFVIQYDGNYKRVI